MTLPALIVGLLLGLGGCATILPTRDGGQPLAGVPAEPLAAAQELARGGQPAKAAAAYLELAEATDPPARQQLEIEAASAMLLAGDTTEATRILTAIDKSKLTGNQRAQLPLLEADVALQRGRAAEAIGRLRQVNAGSLPADQRAHYYGTLAAALRMNGEPLAAAAALDDRDRLLKDPGERMDNQVSLLFTLATLGKGGLDEAAREARGRMRGWVELAGIMSGFGAPSPALDAEFRQWQRGRLGHPAQAGLPRAYFTTLAGGFAPDTEALVLLPRGGPFAGASKVLRDGMQAAYDADTGGNRPSLDFRDTAGNIGRIYDAGIERGADLVIGPLQREDVAGLASRAALPVPTLALNRADGGATGNLFQFALAPEDEAINAANFAFASDLRRAAIIYPNDPWGERMANAFRGQWRTLGGSLAGQETYTPGGNLTAPVATALAAGNADVVFLVATGGDVVPLWEALQVAGNRAPVIATSHVYDGDFNPLRDAALAGLYFVDIPWLLDVDRTDALSRKALRDRLPNVSGPLARLYAMGIDGYRLAPRIADMGRSPGTFFPGETGGLTVDSLGQVRRQLVLARFSGSGPVVQRRLDAAPAPRAATASDETGEAAAE